MAYESKFKKEDIDELFEAVLTLRDLEDCYRFFEDICTINELHGAAPAGRKAAFRKENLQRDRSDYQCLYRDNQPNQ